MGGQFLVADIGGTNARFALAQAGSEAAPELLDIEQWPTASLGSGDTLPLRLQQRFDLAGVERCTLGMAGPVRQGRAALTNGDLVLDAAILARALAKPVAVVNDFAVLAHGVSKFSQLIAVGGQPVVTGPKAVLGAGSGLGMALCLPPAQGHTGPWRVLPSEGGYADLPATSPLEAEVLAQLQAQLDHVCWETVLSGPGLVRLYRCLAHIWGQPDDPEELAPDWITAQAEGAQNPLCHQTVELFLSWLGAAAGNFALATCALGGVYIAGGIAPRLAPMLLASPFRRRFEARGALSPMLASVPVYLVLDPYPGLLGAACHAQSLAD